MAIFKKTAAKKPAKAKAEKATKGEKSLVPARVVAAIVRPRITEKAAHLAGDRVYTFTVLPSATKREIALAVSAIYGVKPVSVNTAKVPGKRRVRGKLQGMTVAMKKAYVRLAPGQTIEFV